MNPIQQRRESERLFNASRCPRLHAEKLALLADESGEDSKWVFERDVLNILLDNRSVTGPIALIGPPGTGKTQMAVSLIHRECGRRGASTYTSARAYVDTARRLHRGATDEEVAAFAFRFLTVDLLVLDNIERSQLRGDGFELIEELIDERYADTRPTMLLSSEGQEEFYAHVGDSIRTRIDERGLLIPAKWPSFRPYAPRVPTCREPGVLRRVADGIRRSSRSRSVASDTCQLELWPDRFKSAAR